MRQSIGQLGRALGVARGLPGPLLLLVGIQEPSAPDLDPGDSSTVEITRWRAPGRKTVALYTIRNGGHNAPSPALQIPRVFGGLGIAILSTPQGVMTGQEARRRNVGGEVICYVW